MCYTTVCCSSSPEPWPPLRAGSTGRWHHRPQWQLLLTHHLRAATAAWQRHFQLLNCCWRLVQRGCGLQAFLWGCSPPPAQWLWSSCHAWCVGAGSEQGCWWCWVSPQRQQCRRQHQHQMRQLQPRRRRRPVCAATEFEVCWQLLLLPRAAGCGQPRVASKRPAAPAAGDARPAHTVMDTQAATQQLHVACALAKCQTQPTTRAWGPLAACMQTSRHCQCWTPPPAAETFPCNLPSLKPLVCDGQNLLTWKSVGCISCCMSASCSFSTDRCAELTTAVLGCVVSPSRAPSPAAQQHTPAVIPLPGIMRLAHAQLGAHVQT